MSAGDRIGETKTRPLTDDESAYDTLIAALRRLQDTVAGIAPPAEVSRAAAEVVNGISASLTPHGVPEDAQFFNRLYGVRGRGQSFGPAVAISHQDEEGLCGTVTFTRFHLGRNAAAHGGAVALLFDSMLGGVINTGGRLRARTVHIEVDYRAVIPLDTPLTIEANLVRVDGRKHFVDARLADDGQVCAEARGLFIALRDGQQ